MDLASKTLSELKTRAASEGVNPGGDRRLKQTWILAIEAATGDRAPEPHDLAAKTSPGVDRVEAVSAIEIQRQEPIESKVERTPDYLDCPSCGAVHSLYATPGLIALWEARCIHCDYIKSSIGYPFEDSRPFQTPLNRLDFFPIAQAETSPGVDRVEAVSAIEIQHQEPPIESKVERTPDYLDCPNCGAVRGLYATCPGLESIWETRCIHCDYLEPSIRHPFEDVRPFEVDRVQKPIEIQRQEPSRFGRIVYPQPSNSPHELKTKTSIDAEADRPQTEPGIKLSDRFLSLYAPPNFSRAHEVEPDGQLKLLERVADPEPPDPDHYINLPTFWAVMNAWNAAFPDSVEQFQDLDIQGQNNAEPNGTGTEQIGADEIAIGAGIHQQCLHSTQPDGNSSSIEIETLGSQKCDRVLAVAGDSQTNQRRFLPDQSDELAIAIFTDEQPPNRGDGRGGRLESESKVSQSAIELAAKTSLSVDRIQKPKSIAHELLELFKSSLDHALACEVEEIPEAILFEGRANETYPVTFSARFISESGTLTISGTDYETVRAQAEELLELHQAEAKLMPTIKNLTAQIDIKERDIQRLNDKISTATKQLRRLENFLKSLGINPQSQTLSYVPRLAEEFKKYGAADEAIAEVVEHDPIPFRLEPTFRTPNWHIRELSSSKSIFRDNSE